MGHTEQTCRRRQRQEKNGLNPKAKHTKLIGGVVQSVEAQKKSFEDLFEITYDDRIGSNQWWKNLSGIWKSL